MKIGILATGITPDELLNEYGSYADMFVQLFQQSGHNFEYQVFDVRDGHFPGGATECDGWIITGSKFNVYQNLPWMQQLKELVLEIHRAERPLVGICFGHQIVADAFGGRVDKYPGGWGVGLHSYEVKPAFSFLKGAPSSFCISAMHQDQVLTKPDNAEVFASSEFCSYAGLVYDDRIMTFQAHPEFNVSYENKLISLRKGDVIPDETAEMGLATVNEKDAETDSVMVAHWMADFLTQRAPAA